MRGITPFVLAAACGALAAASETPASPIEGIWRGTSICVDRTAHPACRDETVVYEFRALADRAGVVRLDAKKIVEGRAETMYLLDFAYDAARGAWVSEFQLPHAHGEWSYVVHGAAMTGRLVDLPSRAPVREVAVRRE